jgi:[NiFe] hydrogenase assembly HybE family chaperone
MTDDDAAAVASRLEGVFRDIWRTRMQGVPVLNAALEVEAVGLGPWDGHWLCALVTPWFINLVVLRGAGDWRAVPDRDSVWYEFPSGRFEFLGSSAPGLGEFHACSLFSPVLEFADHDTARETARAALQALFDPSLLGEPPPGTKIDGRRMSRRDFLRGSDPAKP